MDTYVIKKDQVKPLLDTRFVKVFDITYDNDRHYYDATRHSLDDLVAIKSKEDFRNMLPDAVSCFVILELPDRPPLLLLNREYRYPTGQYLLSVPAGLIDPDDAKEPVPALAAAKREIEEETGIHLTQDDTLTLVNPLVFSSPGITDESNALACAVIRRSNLNELSQSGAVGSERFDGFIMLTADQAKDILRSGRDKEGIFYSLYTWAGLMWFASGMWHNKE